MMNWRPRSPHLQPLTDRVPMPPLDPLPALAGGSPLRPQGPPPWPSPDDDVQRALQDAYRDGSWGKYHGEYVERLERALAAYHGIEFALSCGSGTFAVEIALRALKVGLGDEVVLSAYDYPGNFLAVHAVGAQPLLVDVEPGNWNLSLQRLAEALGPSTRAVIVSHLHGGLVPMRAVTELTAARGLAVVEDAAQTPGALVQGRRAGTWGDAGVLSFGGSKLLTAGRGGALLTARPDVAQRARLALLRGNHICPLSELQAAVLLPQLAKLDGRNARRAEGVRRLLAALGPDCGLRPFANAEGVGEPGYYKLGFRYDAGRFGLPREQFVAALRAEGVAFDEGFRGLHVGRSPKRYRRAGELSEADRAHAGAVVLHHPVLLGEAAEIAEAAEAVRKVHRWARGEAG
jgi:dTDP-4-amino-4,6-dideoxygalactose transaminase